MFELLGALRKPIWLDRGRLGRTLAFLGVYVDPLGALFGSTGVDWGALWPVWGPMLPPWGIHLTRQGSIWAPLEARRRLFGFSLGPLRLQMRTLGFHRSLLEVIVAS